MKEPTTEAGQQLLADFRDEDGEWLAPWRVRGMILAIEAEARRLTVERLTDAVLQWWAQSAGNGVTANDYDDDDRAAAREEAEFYIAALAHPEEERSGE